MDFAEFYLWIHKLVPNKKELVTLSDEIDSHLVLESILGVPQHLYIAVWCCF